MAEAKDRQSRFRSGLAGLWDRLRGEHGKIKDRNALEAYESLLRDRREKDALIAKHLDQRGTLKAQQVKDAQRFESIERDLKQEEERLRSPERSVPSEERKPPRKERGIEEQARAVQRD
jgi:hypothetical protein